jgi:hypothetical protein
MYRSHLLRCFSNVVAQVKHYLYEDRPFRQYTFCAQAKPFQHKQSLRKHLHHQQASVATDLLFRPEDASNMSMYSFRPQRDDAGHLSGAGCAQAAPLIPGSWAHPRTLVW